MKYLYILTKFMILFLIITGFTNCSSSNSQTSSARATAQLGNLANANVNIYEIQNDGSTVLKWNETTSSGDRLEDIGRFNSHAEEMEDSRYYLIEISGGEDWDSDDNGIIDTIPTKNSGTIRAVAKGRDISYAGDNFRVTIITELVYENIASVLKYQFNKDTFGNILQNNIAKIINDIDGDGKIDINDVLQFNPVKNTNKVNISYKSRLKDFVSTIHRGKTALNDTSVAIGSLDFELPILALTVSQDNTKAFLCADDKNLTILDITDLSKPKVINSLDINGTASHIVLNQNETKAYITKFSSNIVTVVDIEDISNPSVITTFDTNGTAYDMAINDDETRAYVAVSNGCVEVLDISDLENAKSIKTFVGDLKSPNSIILGKSNEKAYITITKTNSFYILNVKDDNISILGKYRSDYNVNEITVNDKETKAYLAAENSMVITDISNPENITELGAFKSFNPNQDIEDDDNEGLVKFTKEIRYLNNVKKVVINRDETKAFILYQDIETQREGIAAIDITIPETPKSIGVFNSHTDLLVINKDGTNLFINNSFSEGFISIDSFMILDTTLLRTSPAIIGSYYSSDGCTGIALNKNETVLYLSDKMSLDAVDINNPTNPELLHSIEDIPHSNHIVLNKAKTKAYLATEEGLFIYNLNENNNITLLQTVGDFDINNIHLSQDETKIYLATDNSDGLIILDISDENNIAELGSFETSNLFDIALNKDETQVFITTEEEGLLALDINQTDFSITDHHIDKNIKEIPVYEIETDNNMTLAYITASKELLILNISDENNITKTGSYPAKSYFAGITLNRDKTKAYLADVDFGLVIIDISDPTNPKLIKTYSIDYDVWNIKLNNEETKAYVAGESGVTIIDLTI